MVNLYWYSFRTYKELSENLESVYVLRGQNDEVLYVGYFSRLKIGLIQHLHGPFRDEIMSVDYIVNQQRGNKPIRELEKIPYYLLKPKYFKKKILPKTLYQMHRKLPKIIVNIKRP